MGAIFHVTAGLSGTVWYHFEMQPLHLRTACGGGNENEGEEMEDRREERERSTCGEERFPRPCAAYLPIHDFCGVHLRAFGSFPSIYRRGPIQ